MKEMDKWKSRHEGKQNFTSKQNVAKTLLNLKIFTDITDSIKTYTCREESVSPRVTTIKRILSVIL